MQVADGWAPLGRVHMAGRFWVNEDRVRSGFQVAVFVKER